VPLAWITRATMSSSNTGATAPSSVPAVNSDIAVTKSARVLNRCSSQPVIGMTTASVSMNAVVSHCAAVAVMPKTSMKRGIATPMSVSLRMTTKAEPMSTPSTAERHHHRPRGRRRARRSSTSPAGSARIAAPQTGESAGSS